MKLQTAASAAAQRAGQVILPPAQPDESPRPIPRTAARMSAVAPDRPQRVVLGAPEEIVDLPEETTAPRRPAAPQPQAPAPRPQPLRSAEPQRPAGQPATSPSAGTWSSIRARLTIAMSLAEAAAACGLALLALAGTATLVPRWLIVASAGLLWIAIAACARAYRQRALISGQARLLAPAGAIAVLLLATTTTSMRSLLVALASGLGCLLVCHGVRAVTRWIIRRRWRAGHWLRRAVVVAGPPNGTVLIGRLSRQDRHGLSLLGVCGPTPSSWQGGVPPLGRTADAASVARALGTDIVIADGTSIRPGDLRSLSWQLQRTRTELVLATGQIETAPGRIEVLPTLEATLLGIRVRPTRAQLAAKAALDRLLGAILLILCSPILIGSILAVRMTSPGGAIFRQTRVGVDGSLFTMWKLRTMYANAEELRAALEKHGTAVGPLIKFKSDPRITPLGRFMRKHSIDELPQLANVVAGHMSLVGPRPALPDEVARYRPHERRRLAAKPGMTGLWQVSGREDLTWEESLKLDLRYVDNWTVGMDLSILWATVGAVLGGRGAY